MDARHSAAGNSCFARMEAPGPLLQRPAVGRAGALTEQARRTYRTDTSQMTRYDYTQNDPFDRHTPVRPLLEQRMSSGEFMRSIRRAQVSSGTFALWFLGQNCFVVKGHTGPLVIIDPYLTDSIAERNSHLPFRTNRQVPVFVEPEDLDVDVVLCTHSHDDHTDVDTIRRIKKADTLFVGPYQSCLKYSECGIPADRIRLVHPTENLDLGGGLSLRGVFAMPTDETDLNHMGFVFELPGGIRYYNSGDTAYSDLLASVSPLDIDVCSICINGGFLNLSHFDAARIVKLIAPKVVIPCHYDLMVNNVGNPDMFRASLDIVGATARFRMLDYYEPWVYRKGE